MRKIDRSRGEIADIIERFVEGICSEWEWDDFCSWPIRDPQLEQVRVRCASLPQEFPSAHERHYCAEAGMAIMRQIIFDLRGSKMGPLRSG
jgi:hypothetical protein